MHPALPGFFMAICLSFIAYILGNYFPIVGGPIFAILLGMLVAYFFSKQAETFKVGASLVGKKFLQFAVVFLGFQMNMYQVVSVGSQTLTIMFFTLTVAFLSAWFIGKLLKIDPTTTTLIGVGTSICGASAIAATAPVIKANDKEIAQAISTVFLFNIAAVFVFPVIGHLLNMSDLGFGIWAGTAVNDTSSVLATGYAYSNQAGDLATIVKLTRTLMIIPITFVLSLYISKSQNAQSTFSITRAFPWFIGGFVLAAIVNTVNILPTTITSFLGTLGKLLIILAMAGIGLNTDIVKLLKNGFRPIILGLVCWVCLAVTSLIVQYYMGLLSVN